MTERVVYHDGSPPPASGTGDFEPSLTRQSEKDQADINLILKRFEATGIMPVDEREGVFADVSYIGDYRSALHRVEQANGYFMSLPASLRARFDNDPAKFLDFVGDSANRFECQDLGILASDDAYKAELASRFAKQEAAKKAEPAAAVAAAKASGTP